MNWQDATIEAITSHTLATHRNTFTRQELIESHLDRIVAAVGAAGRTPAQTLSRVLQDLRDTGFIEFCGSGEYRLLSSTHIPVCADLPEQPTVPGRVPATVSRILRDTKIVAALKRHYAFRCQMCDTRLELPSGFYCEAHHIRPLGTPHNGPDAYSNLIVVCPNHHVLLDYGAIPLTPTSLRSSLHDLDDAHVVYHNTRIYERPCHIR